MRGQEWVPASAARGPGRAPKAFAERAAPRESHGATLNANAAEFIPTLSMCCPLLGVCSVPEEHDKERSGCWPPAGRRRGESSLQGCHEEAGSRGEEEGLPPATEEEWQHRIAMRTKSIAVGKETQEYRWFAMSRSECRSAGQPEEDEPLTPDPRDRTISKRQWKYRVQVWRQTLKQQHTEYCSGIEGGSTVSTSDLTVTTEDSLLLWPNYATIGVDDQS